MTIKNIKIWKEDLDLKRPYSIAYKTVNQVESVFVLLEGNTGVWGIGAANPSKAVVGHDVDDTIQLLEEYADQLKNLKLDGIPSAIEQIRTITNGKTGPLTALDIALHDLMTKSLGVSVADYYGRYFNSLPTSITIGIKNVQETLEEAEEYIGLGFDHLKVKLGNDLEEDLERLAKLREQYGSNIQIRIDANQGYSISELEHFAKATQAFNLELIEQPVPEAQTLAVSSLPDSIRKQVAADEYLKTSKDALDLVEGPGACGIFNIKLMKSGGIAEAKQIAHIARLKGIDLMWGCNDESIVSISAALHAALSSPNTKYLDLDGSFDLARDIVSGGFQLDKGRLYLLDQAGLGLTLL